MKHCPNPDCPFFREHGVAAEYEDRVEKCLDCGTQLTPGPAPAPPKKEKEPPLAEWGASALWFGGKRKKKRSIE